jgi:hypothetical protein
VQHTFVGKFYSSTTQSLYHEGGDFVLYGLMVFMAEVFAQSYCCKGGREYAYRVVTCG